MVKHPTVRVPDLGPMDHAWDVMGEWRGHLTSAQLESATATLAFTSWETAVLGLGGAAAEETGWPPRVRLTRTTPIRRSDAGGGALAWECVSGDAPGHWLLTLWPGELQIAVVHPDDRERTLATLQARRSAEYYRAKYAVASP